MEELFTMKKIKMLIASMFLTIGLMPSAMVIAQNNEIGSGLSISPTRTDLVVNAGTAGDLSISVKNVTGGNIVAKAFVNDFESDNVTGEPRLITDSNVKSSSSIKDFIVGLEDLELGVDETKEAKMQIDIPANAAPGAYYGVIRYQAVPVDEQGNASDGGQVALTASVGSIVLVEVPGNITQKIEIKTVAAYLNDKKGSFFTKQPSQVGVEIGNLGNGFARPFGKVVVKDMFGGEVHSYEMNNTNPRGVVLPESTRVFKDPLEGVSKPGRYSINVDISYGNGGEVYSVVSTFWYIPTWLILVSVGLLLAIVGFGYFLFRKYKTRSTKARR
jgi:hypothetical protein